MRGWLLLGALLPVAVGAAPPSGPYKVGVVQTEYFDASRSRPLQMRIWYPAQPEAVEKIQRYDYAYVGWAAAEAAYAPGAGPRPLVLLSHGDRGSTADQCWLAEKLASHGYVAAAVAHYGNTNRNSSAEATIRAWERPRDVSFVATQLRVDPVWSERIDHERIGAAGHSSGGYTVLALAGAMYHPEDMGAYCAGPKAGPDCQLITGARIADIDFTLARRSYHDGRIRAVFAMAPALGPGMLRESLQDIIVPIRIVAATDDEVLLFDDHAARYARDTTGAQLTTLTEGGHFVFMPHCTFAAMAATFFLDHDICGRRSPVDRNAAHTRIVAEAVAFFDQTLGRPAMKAPD